VSLRDHPDFAAWTEAGHCWTCGGVVVAYFGDSLNYPPEREFPGRPSWPDCCLVNLYDGGLYRRCKEDVARERAYWASAAGRAEEAVWLTYLSAQR